MFEQHIKQLKNYIEKELPQFKAMCEKAKKEKAVIIFHQDAYAADYQAKEYLLLGMAIKYAGILGLEIHITGKNRETLK